MSGHLVWLCCFLGESTYVLTWLPSPSFVIDVPFVPDPVFVPLEHSPFVQLKLVLAPISARYGESCRWDHLIFALPIERVAGHAEIIRGTS